MKAMFRHLLKPNSLLAAVLLLTLSGACCLFCYEEMFASALSADEHCPMIKTEHCNFTKGEVAEKEVAVTADSVFECCGLKFNFVVGKLELSSFSDQPVAIATAMPPGVLFSEQYARDHFETVSYRPPLFERPDIHVKNCVFRI